MVERLYNEKEIGALIQRATQLHEEAKGLASGGLTLEEVERIAAELGLPPEHVKAAAREVMEHPGLGRASNVWGGPYVLDQAQIVDATLTDDQWEHAVLALREFTGSTGHASRLGRAREWTHTVEDAGVVLQKTLVTMREKDDRTSIRIRKQFGGGAAVAYIAGFAIMGTATGIALDGAGVSDLVSFALFLGGGAGGLAAARASLSVWTRRQTTRLKQLSHVLQNALVDSQPPHASSAPNSEHAEVREQLSVPEHRDRAGVNEAEDRLTGAPQRERI